MGTNRGVGQSKERKLPGKEFLGAYAPRPNPSVRARISARVACWCSVVGQVHTDIVLRVAKAWPKAERAFSVRVRRQFSRAADTRPRCRLIDLHSPAAFRIVMDYNLNIPGRRARWSFA